MARYGRDWYGPHVEHYERRHTGGGGWRGPTEPGYGWWSRRRHERSRGRGGYAPSDYDFGGRGGPYETGGEAAGWETYPVGRYAEEFHRPVRNWRGGELRGRTGRAAFGRYAEPYDYGEEYDLGEGYGYGDDYGYGEGYDWGAERGWSAPRLEQRGPAYRLSEGEYGAYGGEYDTGPSQVYASRYARQPGPIRYGPTPSSRWPEDGHDVDHLSAREQDMADAEVRDNVKENLFQDTWIDPERIDVDVIEGVVTLTGEVRDFMEARYAWDDAWESAGVRGVINNITVRTDRPNDEMELPQTSGGEEL